MTFYGKSLVAMLPCGNCYKYLSESTCTENRLFFFWFTVSEFSVSDGLILLLWPCVKQHIAHYGGTKSVCWL